MVDASCVKSRLTALKWPRARWVWMGVIVTASVLLCARSIENYYNYFGMYHDDGMYMVSSKALADGKGYCIASLPGEPYQAKYPIGYPFLLACLWKLCPSFPENLFTFETMQVLAAIATGATAVAYLVLTRKVTFALGMVILAASLLNNRYIDCAPMIMSDFPGAFMAIVCLWVTEVVARKEQSVRTALALGALFCLTGMMRVQAMAGVLACLIYLSLRNYRKTCLIAVGVCFLVLTPQTLIDIYQQDRTPPIYSYYTSYISKLGERPPPLSEAWPIVEAIWSSSTYTQNFTYFPLVSKVQMGLLSPAEFLLFFRVGFFALAVVLVTGLVRQVARRSLPGLLCLVYVAPLVFFPAKMEYRQLVPMLPLAYFLYFQGFRFLGRVLKPREPLLRSIYRRLCACLSVVTCIYLVGGCLIESLEKADLYGRGIGPAAPRFSPQAGNSEYFEAFLWIKDHTKASDVFVSNNDPILYLYTGRQAIFPTPVDFWAIARAKPMTSDQMLDVIRFTRSNYIMCDPFYRGIGKTISPADWSAANVAVRGPGALKLVFTTSHSMIRIFSVDRSKLPQLIPGRT